MLNEREKRKEFFCWYITTNGLILHSSPIVTVCALCVKLVYRRSIVNYPFMYHKGLKPVPFEIFRYFSCSFDFYRVAQLALVKSKMFHTPTNFFLFFFVSSFFSFSLVIQAKENF